MKKMLFVTLFMLLAGLQAASGSTFDYWTADGTCKSLPVEDLRLLIPSEATAVDLRGIHSTHQVYQVVSTDANPNCVYFLSGPDQVEGLDNLNWVRDGEADIMNIQDGYPFYTPMAFKAKTATFQMMEAVTTNSDLPGASSLLPLMLPFEARHVMYFDINDADYDLNDDVTYVRTAVLYGVSPNTGKASFVATGTTLLAYVPYVLYNLLPSRLLFFAEDVEFPETHDGETRGFDGVSRFYGSTTGVPLSSFRPYGAYLWSNDEQVFTTQFQSDVLPPFRCCLLMPLQVAPNGGGPKGSQDGDGYGFESLDDSTTALLKAPWHTPANARVYTLSGQPLGTVQVHNGQADTSRLPKGVYIIEGKKVIVK